MLMILYKILTILLESFLYFVITCDIYVYLYVCKMCVHAHVITYSNM